MTSDGEALFRAVCEAPWDDLPRLVYADWLEENGQPGRAAYIRFECEFAGWTTSHPQARELVARSLEFPPFEEQWITELPHLRGVKWWNLFHRGFITNVTFHSPKAFADHADAVFAATPVDSLDVDRLSARTAPVVLGSAYTARLKWLCLRVWYSEVGPLVAACPNLTRLESLLIWGHFTDDGAEALAESPHLGAVRCLSFCNHSLTDRGVMVLAGSKKLAGVSDLVLHGTRGLSARVVRRLRKRFTRLD